MATRYRTTFRWTALFLLMYSLLSPLSLHAEPTTDEETRALLEKSLSVVEIDKEIERIAERKQQAENDIESVSSRLEERQAAIVSHKADAGRVVRSYYMGERDMLLSALVSFNSLSELFTMLDYIDVIFTHDQHTLHTYQTQYKSLVNERARLVQERTQLDELEQSLQSQRQRVAALQADVDRTINGSGNADQLRLLVNELTLYWKTAGLQEVKTYFGALAKAMQDLPDWIKTNKELLEIDGFNYTLHLPEAELNRFLREKNSMFEQFEFTFQSDKVIAHGKRDGLEIAVSGHYTLENKPVNALLFHVDDLVFNGLHLPDTTRSELEKEFDLGFYPQKIVPFIKANSVKITDGEMTVTLSVDMKL